MSTLKDVAQMYPHSVKNVLETLAKNIKDDKETDPNIELLNFIKSAINDIDQKYPNAEERESKNIKENNKKKNYF